ncbi:restriction endonuclease subunit S [Corynebacterium sanguinis]|uniref:restriction endonuclease subunit S n=1 Tax=Corynebacterium sanguinis TaxID=2594913 RepID=UPI0021A72F1F|nr:restriction endonuclease subunit S [Corynebacterium sanguinis]MCT1412972.1 restriction endonuclease subunit S [Corynebacterium sanguinis]
MISNVDAVRLESELFPVAKIHTFGTIVNGGTPTSTDDNWNGDIPFITPPDLNGLEGKEVTSVSRSITNLGLQSGSSSVEKGVIISCRAPVGYVGRVTAPSAFNQGCKVILTDQEHRYVAYVLAASQGNLQILANGTTFPEISSTSLANYAVPLPPLETQQRIADYLDRETAEIDAAVEDLDRYVELLEKRRLLIVDEVLNSQGGAVSADPEMPLKFIIQNRFVGDWGEEPGIAEVDAVCIRVADFNRLTNRVNDQVPTSRSYTREKYETKRLHHHDILIERSGGGDKTPVGSAMLYTGGDEALCANFIEVVRLNSDQLPEYWVHVLRREYMGRKTMRFVKQTTGIQNLDPQGFYDQKFRIPILSEQQRLTSIMRERTSEIESLIAESTKLRNLLLKRRSVLITEVVTSRKQV